LGACLRRSGFAQAGTREHNKKNRKVCKSLVFFNYKKTRTGKVIPIAIKKIKFYWSRYYLLMNQMLVDALGATGSVLEHIAGRPRRQALGRSGNEANSRAGRRTDPAPSRGTPIFFICINYFHPEIK
jgi:hypothetical protein